MRGFTMCPECAYEYHDPTDRRFHAQPVACARCGPRLWFEAGDGATLEDSDAALAAAQAALARGEIVAVKGLGGYHLACDARADAAVERLRARKQRVEKPFAVMVRDLAGAAMLAELDEAECRLLASAQRPIVLVRRRPDAPLSALVAPGNPRVGLLLPYTPLHHLLFARVPGSASPGGTVPDALVMTSGNLTDEPICFDDADARTRLGAIADAWLAHDRPIHVPCDDSVLQVDPETGEELALRRSRGYALLPVRLPFAGPPTLAVGGELKNTFCLASGRDAFMSQHIGDMGSLETWTAFERSTRQISGLYGIHAAHVAADAHPGYQTRRWAEEVWAAREVSPPPWPRCSTTTPTSRRSWPSTGCALEQRVIGVAFDGTGYGEDGTIWGGEILVAGYREAERVGSLAPVPLPGGDAAIRRPCRVALAHLWAAGIEWADDLAPVGALGPDERAVLERQLSRGVGCVPTSSMGRLFDAVSSLVGLRHDATYEAQAAMELQWAAEAALARDPDAARPYRFGMTGRELQPAPVLRALVDDRRAGADTGAMAAGFHAAVARAVADAAASIHARTGLEMVALGGGVFQNTLLLGLARRELEARGLTVLSPRQLPPNDGGLALGQAAVAAARAMTSDRTHDVPGPDGGIVAIVDDARIAADATAAPAEDLAAAALSLARRFAAGATMWCVAPSWPSHARHVAVEFVHPVIVGKRALPAVFVDARMPPQMMRELARPGDVLLAVEHGRRPHRRRPAHPGRRLGAHQCVARGGPAWPGGGLGCPPRRPRGLARDRRRRRGGSLGRPRHALPPVVGAHPRGVRAPGPPHRRHRRRRRRRMCRRRLHHLLGRGKGGRGPRAARPRDASRFSPAVTPNRSTAGSSGTCGRVTWCWYTRAWP